MSRKAFTLAEVLITLSIIGVIGALTVPSLVRDYQQNVYRQKWKKTFSTFAQATKVLESNGNTECIPACDVNGENCSYPEESCDSSVQGHIGIRDAYASVLKYAKKGVGSNTIFASQYYNYKNSNPGYDIGTNLYATLVLMDGTSVSFSASGTLIDVNGQKGPNQAGIDFFALRVKNNAGRIITEPASMSNQFLCGLGLTGNYGSWNCFSKALSNDPMP